MSWSNEETFKFIDLYKTEPCIWNPKHENYKDRNMVQEAWNRIEYAMQIPVTELKKKKETLMTSFRLHYKKILQSLQNNEDEVYKPIWIFYEPLESFLREVYEPSTHDSDSYGIAIATTSHKQDVGSKDDEDDPLDNINDSSSEGKRDSKPKLKMLKRYSDVPELQEVSKEMANAIKTLNQALKSKRRTPSPKVDDDCDLYGRLLAKRLRKFSRTERQVIMYEFDGLLLSRNQGVTVISNNSDLSDS